MYPSSPAQKSCFGHPQSIESGISIISCPAIWVPPFRLPPPSYLRALLQSHLSLFALPAEPNFSNPLKNMASNRGQGGIQQLLAAEQEAQHIVNAARNGKMARLKQAKDEAEKEVAEYRAQVEYEFQKKLTESSGDSGANVKRLEQETDEKIHHLKNEASRISHDVVSMLLKQVTTVRN